MGFVLALAIIVLAEVFVFAESHLLLDRANTSIAFKTSHERDYGGSDVVFIGASQVMLGVDAGLIEDAFDNQLKITNYAVAWTGTNMHFYLSLKKYLKHHAKPKVVFLSIPSRCFGFPEPDGIFVTEREGGTNRFRRYFEFGLLLPEPIDGKWRILREYYKNFFPSLKYKDFIKDFLFHTMVRPMPRMEDVVEINRDRMAKFDQNNGFLGVDHRLHEETDPIKPFLPRYKLTYMENNNQDKSIERFMDLAEQEGIPVVFFHTPIHAKRLPAMETAGWLSYIDAKLAEFEKRYENFSYLKIDKLGYDTQYFSDWVHLNAEGADLFSRDLIRYLEGIFRDRGMLPVEN